MSQPTPADRLAAQLAHLPVEAVRALESALGRAQARAQREGKPVSVSFTIEVQPGGVIAVEMPARYERCST